MSHFLIGFPGAELIPLAPSEDTRVRYAMEEGYRLMRIAAESGSREAVGAVAIGALRAVDDALKSRASQSPDVASLTPAHLLDLDVPCPDCGHAVYYHANGRVVPVGCTVLIGAGRCSCQTSFDALRAVAALAPSGAGTPHDTPDAICPACSHDWRRHWHKGIPRTHCDVALCTCDMGREDVLLAVITALRVGSQPAPSETPDADDLLAFLDDTFSGGNEIRFCATSEPVDERSRTEERGGATVVWVDEPLPVNEFGDTERRHECLSDALRAWYKRDARTVGSHLPTSETTDG